MEGSRFDGFVRTLATGATRRRTLLGIAGSAVAGLLGQVGVEEAAAACVKPGKKGCKGPRNKRCCPGTRCQGGTKKKAGTCVCTGGRTRCGAACVDTTNDPTHCGACNVNCNSDQTCQQGVCACPAGRTQCGADCVDTTTNHRHCGACNSVCNGRTSCRQGVCLGIFGCRSGQQYCGSNPVRCPASANPNCYCATDVEGTLRCVDPITSTCSTCAGNWACGSGQVCIPANNAVPCDCPANACATRCDL